MRIKFRGDLDFHKRLDTFHKKLQGSWKGRLVELFCKVLDVENDKKFRQRGQPAALDELFAQWSKNWNKRLRSSRGKALQGIDHSFERAQRQAAKEATELNALEVAFDEQEGRPSQAPKRRRGDLRASQDGARAPAQHSAPSASPVPSSAVWAPPPPAAGGPSQGAAHAPRRRRGRAQHLSTCIIKQIPLIHTNQKAQFRIVTQL